MSNSIKAQVQTAQPPASTVIPAGSAGSARPVDSPEIGGKARQLDALRALGLRVPAYVVVPAHVLLDQLPFGASPADLQRAVRSATVPETVRQLLVDHFGPYARASTYAVRSSATDEDGTEHSFAGQYDSYLHVPFPAVAGRIRDVWASVLNERAAQYRTRHGLPTNYGIAVIVQRMVPADVAGVAFGADPVTGARDTVVVNAVYGLGEGLVSGELTADTYRLRDGRIDAQIATKTHGYIGKYAGGGTQRLPIDARRQRLPALTEAQVRELGAVLDKLTETHGTPQDVEFAYYGGQLYLLQARPVTTLVPAAQGAYTLWDNSNIVESYPGITTPLTFSFIQRMYERVYRQFVGLMGVSASQVDRHADVFANTLGLVRGRVYYNLLHWYKMLALMPGYTLNAGFMEQMMGVKERFELDESFRGSRGRAWLRTIYMVVRMIGLQLGLGRSRRRFRRELDAIMAEYAARDFDGSSVSELVAAYEDFEARLLLRWKAPLVNDFFAMIWFGLLRNWCTAHCPDHPNLHNDLLCGSEDIISVEPVRRALALAREITGEPVYNRLFTEESPDRIWEELNTPAYAPLRAAFDEYLARFGERCVGELKLETISYAQDPVRFVRVVQGYVRNGASTSTGGTNTGERLRAEAESVLQKALRSKPLQARWVKLLLRQTRDLVSQRENLRFERTRGFGVVRRLFTALGQRLHRDGQLDHPRDVFYLELDEIRALRHASTTELRPRIAERQATFAAYRKQAPPQPRFCTYGNEFTDADIYATDKLTPASAELRGTGCCPGRVRGRVRVITDPTTVDSLRGDILVTTSTDPGWVTLFPTAAALLVERGSLLSHSAIVAREMGIPCVVAIDGLLHTLRTGDTVELDGSSGWVRKCAETPAAAAE